MVDARRRQHTMRRETRRTFDPRNTAGSSVVGWYQLSDIGTLWKDAARTLPVTTSGDVVLGVTDKSGGGRHLSVAANGPAYIPSVLGGLGALRFDGVDDVLVSAASAFSFGTGVTMFCVAKTTTPANSKYMVSGDSDRLFLQSSASPRSQFGGAGNVDYSTTESANGNLSNFVVLAGTLDYTLASHEANLWSAGTASAAWAFNANNTTSVLAVTMALGATPTPVAFWTGDMAEVILCNAVLAPAAINEIAIGLGSVYSLPWTAVAS